MSSKKVRHSKIKSTKRTKQISFLWTRRTRVFINFNFKTQKVPRRQQLPPLRQMLISLLQRRSAGKQKKRDLKKPTQDRFINFVRHSALVPLLLSVIGLGGTLYFGLQTGKVVDLQPVKAFALPTPKPAKVESAPKGLPRSEPTHVNISAVGINYPIITVGREADGAMEIPKLYDPVVGWYKYSPTPGEIGPTVLVGHVDTQKGPSVFWRLRDLKAGDEVEVTRADGQVIKYKVEALKQFDQNNFPSAEVYGNIDHAGLRLITCGGTFDRKTGAYTANTVVFASAII